MSARRFDLAEGDVVYVRMEYRRAIGGTDAAQCYVRDPEFYSFVAVPVPISQIVYCEPRLADRRGEARSGGL
jgi:hypothetical protein